MAILMLHGYLLRGTGSNLYVRNLVRQLCMEGTDVVLLCQEDRPQDIDFVCEAFELLPGNRSAHALFSRSKILPGRCVVVRPHIGSLLPVYVFDHYPGFSVKIFPDCSDDEIEFYAEQSRQAVNWALENYKIHVVQTNHLIMLPFVMATVKQSKSQCPEYFCTVHGSALNFSVKRDPRLVRYADIGLRFCRSVFVDSRYARQELTAFLDEKNLPGMKGRIAVIPAGVDTDRFKLREHQPRQFFLKHLIALLGKDGGPGTGRDTEQCIEMMSSPLPENGEQITQQVNRIRSSYDYLAPDRDVGQKLSAFDRVAGSVVVFVGKYLWTKGIHLILLAIPSILDKYPNTQFLLVGFGPFREPAELMINCLVNRRLDILNDLIEEPSPLFLTPEGNPIPLLIPVWRKQRKRLEEILTPNLAERMRGAIHFTGVLNHEQLPWLLPCADVLLAPSVFPEAFGMVAIEALACGIYPVLTYQSAFREIVDEIDGVAGEFGLPIRQILPDDNAVSGLIENVDLYFQAQERLEKSRRMHKLREAFQELAETRYSWKSVVARYRGFYGKYIPVD